MRGTQKGRVQKMTNKSKRLIAMLFCAGIIAILFMLAAANSAQAENIAACESTEQIFEPVAAVQDAEAAAVQQDTYTGQQAAYIPSTDAEDGYISEAELMEICEAVGGMYDICPELLEAIAERESTLLIEAQNSGCYGLMQISTYWHTERMERLGVSDIYEPYGNILVAADYLAELFKINQDTYYVLMRYNMATDTAERLYSEGDISDYAKGIVARAAELERLHGK